MGKAVGLGDTERRNLVLHTNRIRATAARVQVARASVGAGGEPQRNYRLTPFIPASE